MPPRPKPRIVRVEPTSGSTGWVCDEFVTQVATDTAVVACVSKWHGRGKTPAEAYSNWITRQMFRFSY